MTNDEGPIGKRGPPRSSEGPVKRYSGINGKPGAPDKSEKDWEKENLNLLIFLAAMVQVYHIHKTLKYGKHS